ncbi:hypothetical protein FH972_022805 [Carpinus fangiana]|uniref:Urease accessory protein UreD n=1 Tax=Carpinus fangiana TaxID=176857 RepID=A0A5N6KTT3_9ROSI|nr:hypothetical protein FH972_022805 [Carpinus fangiana]
MTPNPFPATSSKAGHGEIRVSLLPPDKPVLETMSYQYPLKLISPPPVEVLSRSLSSTSKQSDVKGPNSRLVYTVFLLTYGGGLVGGDSVDLSVSLASSTRLVLLTQGSTKIFKSPTQSVLTSQVTSLVVGTNSALLWLPDPVQPFADSSFQQTQRYKLADAQHSNVCVLDWVCEGRKARDETWDFWGYRSMNEVWLEIPDGPEDKQDKKKEKLLLRDSLILDSTRAASRADFRAKMQDVGAYGTLVLGGSLFASLGAYFLSEFRALPRIGNKQWDAPPTETVEEAQRARRVKQEEQDGLLWTAATVRSLVIVKFGARETEGAKRWLATMLKTEGTVVREFGEGSLLCLR